jgi:hypothetical protein
MTTGADALEKKISNKEYDAELYKLHAEQAMGHSTRLIRERLDAAHGIGN